MSSKNFILSTPFLLTDYSMVNFIKPSFLGTEKEFNNLYGNPIKSGQHKDSSKQEIKVMKQRSYVLHNKLSKFVQVSCCWIAFFPFNHIALVESNRFYTFGLLFFFSASRSRTAQNFLTRQVRICDLHSNDRCASECIIASDFVFKTKLMSNVCIYRTGSMNIS